MNIKDKIKNFIQKKQNTILSASLVLAITFTFSAILGFLRSRFLYSYFFSCCTAQLDAYNAAFRLPDLIFKLLVTGALSASFIPVFSSYVHKNQKTAHELASTVINLLLILFTIISIIIFIFAKPFSQLIATGFSPEQIDVMVKITRILLVGQIFFLISNFITGMLQVHQTFIIPALSPIVYNIFIILSIFTLTPIFGIYGAAYGAVVGAFFHLAIQIPSVRRQGFNYSFILKLKDKGVKEIVRLTIPRTLAIGLGEIENTVTLFFASTLQIGSISLFNLALQIMYLPSRIFGTTIGQASLPILSKNIAKNELNTFRTTVSKIILQSLYIALPITVLILVHRVAIIRLAFGAKQFPWAATLLTAKTLAYLTPAIASQAVIQILIRSFYALHNTKTPLYVSLIALVVNITSSFYFINYTDFGIIGLAISASLGNLTQLSGLLYMFVKRVDGFQWFETVKHFNKIFISSLVMALSTWSCLQILDIFVLDTTKTFNLIVLFTTSSLIGFISFIMSSVILNVEEYHDYRNQLLKFKRFVFRIS